MKFKHAFIICMVFLAILTIGFASASDNSTSTDGDFLKETSEVDGDEITLSSQDRDVSYGAINSTGTFRDLNTAINESTGELNLTRNYAYSEGDLEYIEGIIIDKQITINGNGFTINGNDQARAFNITAFNVLLNNITFTNCCAEKGGAIYNYGTVTLNNDVFINNRADRGGAIFTNGNMVLNGSSFNNNVANSDGGAITISSGDVDLYDVVFSNNAAGFSGAITNNGGFVNMSHVVFMNNTARGTGGAIYNFNIMNLYDVVFSNNVANYGSGIANEYKMNLYNAIFSNNTAMNYATICNWNIMALHGVAFSNNVAPYGGAICNYDYLSIEDSVFANTTSKYSSAIYTDWGQLFINNTRFVNLVANGTGGAISVKYGVNVYIENCEFINTSSLKNAGAINIDVCGNVTILDTLFRNASSAFGGAFVQLDGKLFMNNTQFINDFASLRGGAVYLSFVDAQINNCTFDSNAAGEFDDYVACGGAIYCDISNLTLTNSKFINNSASQGNAIYAYDSSYNITKSIFINNSGAIYTEFDGEGYLDETNVYLNSNVSTNNTYYQLAFYGEAIELKLINNTIDVADVPSRFNLHEWGWVTPVKNQELKGFCWVFSLIASLESGLLKATGVEYDFSENHNGNNGIQYGKYGKFQYTEGGDDFCALGPLLNWIGLVSEQEDSYDGVGKLSDLSDTANNIHLQDMLFIPVKFDNGIFSNETNNLIKQTVLKYGAIPISFYGDEGFFGGYTISVYNNDWISPNHEVAIVGWDDSYSRDNFDVAPPGDGAWIFKNSWGNQWGYDGYGYISYYDASLFQDNDYPFLNLFIFENTENYICNYQTDLAGLSNFDNDYVCYSNEYTSIGNGLLGAVGTYFNDTGVEYELKIYVNDELRLVQTGMSEFAGFRTIVLDKYIPIKTGDRFKVVFKSNTVPCQMNSRQHYLPNVSMISVDGKSWIDFADLNGTVCLKAYAVVDDTKITDNKDISIDYASGKYFTVRVVTGDGHAVGAGEVVNFKINGKTTSVLTDGNGMAKIKITDVPGEYEITTTYKNQTYKNIVDVKLNLNTCKIIGNKNINVDYAGGKYFTAKVTSADGKVVAAGASVKFIINGKTVTVKTDKNGIAKIKITDVPGTYTIKTVFNGKTYKNKVTVKQVLKTKKVTVKKTDKIFSLKAALKINGKNVNGKTVIFKFNGKTYKVKTNSKGVAQKIFGKKIINKLKKGKTYAVKVSYGKDTIKTIVKVR